MRGFFCGKGNFMKNDTFTLYNLRVEIVKGKEDFVCSHHIGDYFEVIGENLHFPQTTSFSLYALSAILPLLPAKQRRTVENDWMTTDHFIACPDPNCAAQFKISRVGKTIFHHSEVTKTTIL